MSRKRLCKNRSAEWTLFRLKQDERSFCVRILPMLRKQPGGRSKECIGIMGTDMSEPADAERLSMAGPVSPGRFRLRF